MNSTRDAAPAVMKADRLETASGAWITPFGLLKLLPGLEMLGISVL